MSIHRYHPDPTVDNDESSVVFDDCRRCAEHAVDPGAGLDDDHLLRLWDHRYKYPRTHNELVASRHLEKAVGLSSRLFRILISIPDQESIHDGS